MNSPSLGTSGNIYAYPSSVLIVSNGHGEDAVGMALAAEIGSVAQLAAFPLAGAGAAYRGIPMLDPRRQLPSGGFGLRGSWRAVWADLRAGIGALWLGERARVPQPRGPEHLGGALGHR